jgi:hypothetical protein
VLTSARSCSDNAPPRLLIRLPCFVTSKRTGIQVEGSPARALKVSPSFDHATSFFRGGGNEPPGGRQAARPPPFATLKC